MGAVVNVLLPNTTGAVNAPLAPLVLNVVAAFILTVLGETLIVDGTVAVPPTELKFVRIVPVAGQAVVAPLELVVPHGVPVVQAPE